MTSEAFFIRPDEANEEVSEIESASLLKDTVDQFEKVIGLERTLLRKSMRTHQRDFEEVSTELGMKEEELALWEERVQQIRKDNEVKFALAKARFDGAKFRGRSNGRNAQAGNGGMLGLIEEAEDDEEDDDNEDGQICRNESKEGFFVREDLDSDTTPAPGATPTGFMDGPAFGKPSHPAAEAVNALADILASEISGLKRQWQELSVGAEALSQTPGAPRQQVLAAGQQSAPLPDASSRGRMTVEQRIDRLQKDIRTETDRILQERGGTPSFSRRTPMPTANTSVMSSGSLMVSEGIPQQSSGLQGLHTPGQSVSSRLNGSAPFVEQVSRTPSVSESPSQQLSATQQPMWSAPKEDPAVTPSPGSSASHPAMAGVASNRAPGFHVSQQPVGSVVRCISPSGGAQVARGRVQQYVQGRPVASMTPHAAGVRHDNLQSSTASGPPRRAGYTSQPAGPAYSSQTARHSLPPPQPGQQLRTIHR